MPWRGQGTLLWVAVLCSSLLLSFLVPLGPATLQARCQRTLALTREWLFLPGRGGPRLPRAWRPPSFMARWLTARPASSPQDAVLLRLTCSGTNTSALGGTCLVCVRCLLGRTPVLLHFGECSAASQRLPPSAFWSTALCPLSTVCALLELRAVPRNGP